MTICFSVKENTKMKSNLKLDVFQIQKEHKSFHSKNKVGAFYKVQDKSNLFILLVNKYISKFQTNVISEISNRTLHNHVMSFNLSKYSSLYLCINCSPFSNNDQSMKPIIKCDINYNFSKMALPKEPSSHI